MERDKHQSKVNKARLAIDGLGQSEYLACPKRESFGCPQSQALTEWPHEPLKGFSRFLNMAEVCQFLIKRRK
jgi:hypothetical protein